MVEKSFVDGGHEDFNQPGMREIGEEESGIPEIIFQPLWGKAQAISYEETDKAGHGGGDKRMLKDIFAGVEDDPLGHAAGYIDGAKSILSGIAANKSIATGVPVRVADLVKF